MICRSGATVCREKYLRKERRCPQATRMKLAHINKQATREWISQCWLISVNLSSQLSSIPHFTALGLVNSYVTSVESEIKTQLPYSNLKHFYLKRAREHFFLTIMKEQISGIVEAIQNRNRAVFQAFTYAGRRYGGVYRQSVGQKDHEY